jgi:hypothetical protein
VFQRIQPFPFHRHAPAERGKSAKADNIRFHAAPWHNKLGVYYATRPVTISGFTGRHVVSGVG